ncbi:MAG TPA: DedA family protein/thiosulfate sulfurtransferase GlpE [Methylibium sp.]
MQQLVTLLIAHGVLLVFAVTLAARIGAPLPAAPLLVVAGGLAAGGDLSWGATLLASIAANIAGDGLWFEAGRRHGYRVLRLLCRISLSPDACVRQSESLIARWGGSSLIAAKFLPGVSVVAAPMAGALRMPVARFLGYELAAALLWTGAYLLLGVVFSSQIQQVLDAIASAGMVATAALALLLLVWGAARYWRRRSALRDATMARITVGELQALMRDGHDPVIIDVRSDAGTQVDARRIPGALLVPLERIHARAAELPRDREIVLYCNCPNEVSAVRAAQLLAAQGLERVRPLAGGLDAWSASIEGTALTMAVGAAAGR